ncbi:hypothetical protein [Sphingomonas phyllosphaerae]|uniref:hypothetical protein n=1 Tax=Sphingomonas phyllosphaerae TaxID=257003 RepID=UPI0024130AD6|nr:hypothetical protein [Sphingomonas phyllosphaerae]
MTVTGGSLPFPPGPRPPLGHLFYREYTRLVGTGGFFNERRTIGLELGLRF